MPDQYVIDEFLDLSPIGLSVIGEIDGQRIKSNDTIQNHWEVDAAVLHVWS